MDERTFTAAEILQILNDAKGCAERRAALSIISPEEARGWTTAIVNIAKRLGIVAWAIEQWREKDIFGRRMK